MIVFATITITLMPVVIITAFVLQRRKWQQDRKLKLVTLRMQGECCGTCLWIDVHGQVTFTCGLRKFQGGAGDVPSFKRCMPISKDDICEHHTARET